MSKSKLKVCLVSAEYFKWPPHGGFGWITRKLGAELVKRGVEVEAFIMAADYAKRVPVGCYEDVDGVSVKTLPRIRHKLTKGCLYKTDADIIHSESCPVETALTFYNNPDTPKLLTFQDLRSYKERHDLFYKGGETYSVEWSLPSAKMLPVYWVTWFLAKRNVFGADVVSCQAHLLKPKVKTIFGYGGPLAFLPNFVDMPVSNCAKSKRPSVVWLGRLDHVKHPELMFALAEKMPEVDFYVLGHSHFPDRERWYQNRYGNNKVKNVFLLGHQEGAVKEVILSKAWVLLNTSYYECMPISFLEALAHKCALLSTRNPDGYTERFGYFDGSCSVAGLKRGLECLLMDDAWRGKGEAGYSHVLKHHETGRCLSQHINLYRRMVE